MTYGFKMATQVTETRAAGWCFVKINPEHYAILFKQSLLCGSLSGMLKEAEDEVGRKLKVCIS